MNNQGGCQIEAALCRGGFDERTTVLSDPLLAEHKLAEGLARGAFCILLLRIAEGEYSHNAEVIRDTRS